MLHEAAPGPAPPGPAGLTCNWPPLVVTATVLAAAGLVGTVTWAGPPNDSAVTAYGPPGSDTCAGPPLVLTWTDRGALAKPTAALPPSVVTRKVADLMPLAMTGPSPALPAPLTVTLPPSEATLSAPRMAPAVTGPPPESRSAVAAPLTSISPPSLAAVTATPAGTVTVKPTEQPESAQDGAQRERDVLALMAEGRSNPEIAATLVITESAVSKHINSIFAKLGLYQGDTGHRRVLAVLRYLGAAPAG